ncbi:ubiquitin thioesterase otubain-like isoform X4 [Dendrobium catenatum]|uniref:ubiquitin thioesterase otubain-like isoform X4 n=1 Tax=Dendrobium catenatum TaxID=906689 RepID=UPI00109F1A50|nr:ubiquitin thioesterase otubain-like isoform X4 [Dendrobium catenatum]
MPLDVVVVGSRWWPMMMITAKPASEIDLKSLVQDKEPLLNLEQDVTSHRVLKKIKELHEKYASFRRVRGDGNCFFRAFKFAYLEHILLMNDTGEANRILTKVEEFKYRILLDHMASSETLISDYEAFRNIVTLVSSSSENRISHAVLLQWSKDEDGYSDPAIRFLRMVTSNEICKRQNHFEQSIQGLSCDNAMTVQKFCEIEVEPMDKDVDNVQIIALVDALGVPIRIEYLQDSEHKLNHYDFGIEASPLEEPYITLLYRPGHYDILYTKEYHVVVPELVEVVLKDSEIPKKEPRTIAKVPLTSEMDPSEKEEDIHMAIHTFIRRKGRKDYQTEWTSKINSSVRLWRFVINKFLLKWSSEKILILAYFGLLDSVFESFGWAIKHGTKITYK